MRKIQVYIDESLYHGGLDIWITEETEGSDKWYVAKPVKLEFERGSMYTITEPTLRITRRQATPFLQALAEALDKRGIKTENDHRIQGMLEATRLHLNDMRLLAGVTSRVELKDDKEKKA